MGCNTSKSISQPEKATPQSALKKPVAVHTIEKQTTKKGVSVSFQGDLGQPAKTFSKLRILHFNDVYNIQEKPKTQYKGGAARFVTAMRHYRAKAEKEGVEILTCFSGDLLGPSLISTMFEGEQMVPSFNECKVDVACIGNHDLDFGIVQMDKCLAQTMKPQGSCQWLMTNLIPENKPLDGAEGIGSCLRTVVIQKAGIKIGLIGIAEKEWINILKNLEVDIVYQNYKRTAAEYAKRLREQEGCEYIIALTHMRVAHDSKFAKEVPGIDLVLGGHDHEYHSLGIQHEQKNTETLIKNKVVPLVKSATDFLDMSEIDVTFNVTPDQFNQFQEQFASSHEDQRENRSKLIYSEADQTQYIVNRIRLADGDWQPDQAMVEVEKKYLQLFQEQMGHTVGYLGIDLESQDSIIRREETNFGNFIADLMRTEYATDFAIVNSGSFRKNAVIPQGPMTLLQIQESFPFNDQVMVLKMKGSVFLKALNYSMSAYPAEEGRFPQVSNIQFFFDPEKPEGQKVLASDVVTLAGGNFDVNRFYTVACPAFLADGGDGYTMFKDEGVQTIVDDETGFQIIEICKQFLRRTQTDFKIVPKRELARQMRLRLFNVDTEDEIDGRSPDGKFFQIKPMKEGRILIKGQQIPEEYARMMSHINPNQ